MMMAGFQRHVLKAFCLTLLCFHAAEASWVTVNSTYFESVLGVNDSIILGTGYDGVYRSIDSGKTWTRVGSELNGFVAKDSVIFAGAPKNGIWKSLDSGATWRSVYTYQGDLNVWAVGNIQGRLLAGTDNGVYYSDNFGMKWINTKNGLAGNDTVLAFYTFDKIVVAKTPRGAYRSLDSGCTWSNLTPMFSINSFAINRNMYYAASKQTGLMYSSDSGRKWQSVYVGSYFTRIDFLAVYKGNVLFGSTWGLFLSNDNGVTWKNLSAESKHYLEGSQAIVGDYLYNGTGYPNPGEYRRPMAELIDAAESVPPKPDTSLWQRTNGPQGGRVNSFACFDTAIFATVSGDAVYRSLNNGATWQRLPMKAQSLASNGTFLFAADGGVYRSSNYGSNWVDVNNSGIRDISTLYAFGGILYAGGRQTGVFRTDYGVGWIVQRSGLQSYWVNSFGMAGQKLLVGSSNGLYLYNDKGYWDVDCRCTPDWYQWGNLGSVYCFASMGKRTFTGTRRGLVYSDDTAYTWKSVSDSLLKRTEITCLAVTGNAVFAGAGNVYRSLDSGATWTNVGSSVNKGGVLSLFAKGGTMFAGFDGGAVYCSSDNGESWSRSGGGMTGSSVTGLAASGNYLFAGTTAGLFRTSDAGDTWSEADSGLSNRSITALSMANGGILAGTFGGGIFFSGVNGDQWIPSGTGLTDDIITALAQVDNTEFASTLYDGIFSSDNNGMSWTRAGFKDTTIEFLSSSGSRLYAATSNGVYYSDDKGVAWKNCVFSGGSIYCIRAVGNSILAGTTSGIFLSSGPGATWSQAQGAASGLTFNSIEKFDTFLVASASKYGNVDTPFVSSLYRSMDKGATWILADSGLPSDDKIISFAAKDGFIFAGTNSRGVWRRPIAQMTGIKHAAILTNAPQAPSMRLLTNHNGLGNVIIKIALPRESNVSIKAFSLSGREIATVVNQKICAGAHTMVWNGNGIASGCCIVLMRAGSATCVQRFTLCR
jgi:photosystem II stability/assembly factor-like uncharacterized protein